MSRNYVKATPQRIEWLKEQCRGKSGTFESESYVHRDKADSEFVEFVTTGIGADAARILDRCGSAVTHFWTNGDQVVLKIRKTVNGKRIFRGLEYAFAPVDVVSNPFPGK